MEGTWWSSRSSKPLVALLTQGEVGSIPILSDLMQKLLFSAILTVTASTVVAAPATDPPATTAPVRRSRTFFFDYDVAVTGVPADQVAHIWVPVPPSNEEQSVEEVSSSLPSTARTAAELKHGNTVAYFEAKASDGGEIPIHIRYRITRREVGEEPASIADDPQKDLQADNFVPIGGKPATLLVGRTLPRDPLALGRALYDLVDDHLKYGKEKPGWGRGDASWSCDSRTGNCTDFHSLFISLARTSHLPARFEIGFAVPEARGFGKVDGYHCWAKFRADAEHWVPVDISEANKHSEKRDYFFGHLCENRVMFSTGRDLVLEPKQDGPPVNFFVYPYVEIAGQPWPAERLRKSFAYSDVPVAATR